MADTEEVSDGDVEAGFVVSVPEDAEGSLSGEEWVGDGVVVVDGESEMRDRARAVDLGEGECSAGGNDAPIAVVAIACPTGFAVGGEGLVLVEWIHRGSEK